MTLLNFTPAIPINETILVTGANGYIGAHVVDQLIAYGYRVRGTVRSPDRARWLEELIAKKHGAGKMELVKVENIAEEGAFDQTAEGVAGIIHVATDANFPAAPEPYIAIMTTTVLGILRTAQRHPSIKRVILTSSSMGAVSWKPNNVEFSFGTDAYNHEAIKEAYELPSEASKSITYYAAAKAISEQAAFEWLEREKPLFVFNSVVPSANFGLSLGAEYQSTGELARKATIGEFDFIQYVPPQHFIDVVDDAKLHVAALIHPDIKGERLFGFAEPYNWNTVIETVRKLYPSRKFADGIQGLGRDLSHPPTERALFALKSLGAPGWTSLEDSLKASFDKIYA